MNDLSTKCFGFSPSVEARELNDGSIVLRHLENGEYLNIPSDRSPIIREFDGELSVEKILHAQLSQGRLHGIRAFYDLVMSAVEKGLLVEGSTTKAPTPSKTISEENKSVFTAHVAMSVVLIGLGFTAMYKLGVGAAGGIVEWFIVLATVSITLSLSYIIASSALTSFGRRAILARIRWNRIIPYFTINTSDAIMGGRNCEIALSLRGLTAPFVVAVAAWIIGSPTVLLGAYLALAALASPFGKTPAHQLLHALLRKDHSLPLCAERFLNTRLIQQIFNWKSKLVEENYLMAHSSYAIVWLGGVFYFANLLLGRHTELYQAALRSSSASNEKWITLAVLGTLVLIIVGTLAYVAWLAIRWGHRWAAPRLFAAEAAVTKKASGNEEMSETERSHFLKKTLLFSQIPDEALKNIGRVTQVVRPSSGSTIIRERDPGQTMFVIVSGNVEVLKEDESGNQRFVTTLTEGDVFGEIVLIDDVPRTSSVKATTNTTLLALDKEAFRTTVLPLLGTDQIREIVQVSAFLKRNQLFEDWHENALIKLAKRFEFETFESKASVLKQGSANEAFHLVYEGDFSVVKDGQEVAKLKPGDFCGEVSLLKDTPANATVQSEGSGRCLKLGKADFLEFISHDFLTGIAIDKAAQTRSIERKAA
ncbi:cyclic nucleotide-binding domain-containing protein [Verrucomicrobia bacterium]|nr:cyclic nucleotide-binding domain-containing protein [Verrucomicrobiota bacterium]